MRKLYSTIFTYTILMSAVSLSQTNIFTTVYYNNQSAQGYASAEAIDKSILVAGEANYGGAMIMKLDSAGNLLWSRTHYIIGNEVYNDIVETKDSNFLACGKIQVNSGVDALVTKISGNGDTIWNRILSFGGYEQGMQIIEASDGSIIVAGTSDQTGPPYSHAFIAKLDSAGNLLWGKTFYGGNNSNHVYALREAADSSYLLSGLLINTSPAWQNGLLAKISTSGNLIWSKSYSYTGNTCINDFIELPDGKIMCYLGDNNGTGLVKTDSAGTIIWTSITDRSNSLILNYPANNMTQTANGGFAITVEGEIVKLDSSGNFVFSETLIMMAAAILETSDDGLLMLGNGPLPGITMGGLFTPHIGIIKMDSLGYSAQCTSTPTPPVVSAITISQPVIPLTFQSAGVSYPVSFTVDTTSLLSYTGCVDVMSGTQEHSSSYHISVYPNPAGEAVRITGKTSIRKIEVYDSAGKRVLSSGCQNSDTMDLDLSDFNDGIYLIRVHSDDRIASRKLIISR